MSGWFETCSRFHQLFAKFKSVHVFICSGVSKLFSFKFLYINFKTYLGGTKHVPIFKKQIKNFEYVHVFIFSGVSNFCSQIAKKIAIFKYVHVFIFFRSFDVPDLSKYFSFFLLQITNLLLCHRSLRFFNTNACEIQGIIWICAAGFGSLSLALL